MHTRVMHGLHLSCWFGLFLNQTLDRVHASKKKLYNDRVAQGTCKMVQVRTQELNLKLLHDKEDLNQVHQKTGNFKLLGSTKLSWGPEPPKIESGTFQILKWHKHKNPQPTKISIRYGNITHKGSLTGFGFYDDLIFFLFLFMMLPIGSNSVQISKHYKHANSSVCANLKSTMA